MSLRHRRAVVATATLLALFASACDTADVADEAPPPAEGADPDAGSDTAEGGSDGAGSDAGSDDAGSAGGTDGGSDGDREETSGHAEPQVPPLLAEIDGLAETVVTITTAAGPDVRVDAKVAASPDERRRGLMQVPELPGGVGMLFLFDGPRTGGFWMRDTLVPLDIAYVAEDGRIGTILAMDPCTADEPADCPVYTPDQPYHAALEVPQGWFADQGVVTGDQVAWTDPVPAG